MIANITPEAIAEVNALVEAHGGGRRGRVRVACDMIDIALINLPYLIDVANLSGLSPSTVGSIRRQRTVPSLDTVRRLYVAASYVMPRETAHYLAMARYELKDRSLRARDY